MESVVGFPVVRVLRQGRAMTAFAIGGGAAPHGAVPADPDRSGGTPS